jgi:hypothetical protein
MKKRILLLLCLLGSSLQAQSPEVVEPVPAKPAPAEAEEFAPGNIAFVRIVNAIGLKTPTRLSLRRASEPTWTPFEIGEASSMMPMRLGSYNLNLENAGCEKPQVKDSVDLSAGGYYLIVVYTEEVVKDDKIVHRLQYSKLRRSGSNNGAKLSIVSLVSQDALPVELNGRQVTLPPRRAQHFDVKVDDEISIAHGGQPVTATFPIVEEISYIVFLYRNEASKQVEGTLAKEINVVLEIPRALNGDEAEAEKPKAEPQP